MLNLFFASAGFYLSFFILLSFGSRLLGMTKNASYVVGFGPIILSTVVASRYIDLWWLVGLFTLGWAYALFRVSGHVSIVTFDIHFSKPIQWFRKVVLRQKQ